MAILLKVAQRVSTGLCGLFLCLLSSGCLAPESTWCKSGLICPPGTVCAEALGRCVQSWQLGACQGKGELDQCTSPGQPGIPHLCVDGLCVPGDSCGNGLLEAGEECEPLVPLQTSTQCVDLPGYHAGSMTCSSHCTLSAEECWRAGWVPMTEGATYVLEGVWGSGPQDAYAVGGDAIGGFVLHFDGETWETVHTTEGALTAVWGSASDDIFVVGNDGMQHYDGSTWTPMPLPHDDLDFTSIWGAASDDVFATTNDGEFAILHYDGQDWSVVHQDVEALLFDIAGSGPEDVYAVGLSGHIFHYDGALWTTVDTGAELSSLTGVYANAPDDVTVVGFHGQILHFDGVAWTASVDATQMAHLNFMDVSGIGPSDVFAVGTNQDTGAALVGYHDGLIWRFEDVEGTSLNDVHPFSLSDGFAVGRGILRFKGRPWEVHLRATTAWYGDIWAAGPEAVFALGSGATQETAVMARFDGATWHETPLAGANVLVGIWGTAADNVFACGLNGAIHRFDGTAWTPMVTPVNMMLSALNGSGPSNIFAVGESGTILRFNGSSWILMNPGVTDTLLDVWAHSNDLAYAVGYTLDPMDPAASQGIILRYNGAVWQVAEIVADFQPHAIWGTSPTNIWVAGVGGENGALYHYDGGTLQEASIPDVAGLYAVGGRSADDAFVAGNGLDARMVIFHYDGNQWSPMKITLPGQVTGLTFTGEHHVYAAAGAVLRFTGRLGE